MNEQKELQTNSAPSQVPPSAPIPSGIPHDASVGMGIDSPVEPEKPIEVTPDIEIPTLRTYKSDVHQTVNKDKISTAKIFIAEQNRRRKQDEVAQTSIKRPTNIVVLLLSIILIVASLGGIAYFGYTRVLVKTFEPIAVPVSFLFIFDQEKLIEISEDTFDIPFEVQKQVASLSTANNETYTDIVFYKIDPTTEENSRITSTEFLELFEINLPTNIRRSISNSFVYGMYKTDGKIEPFLVLGINDYEVMYSSMFVWESTLALDIKDLFPVLKDLFDLTKRKQLQIAIDAATTTPATSTSISATSTATTTPATTTVPIVEVETELTPEEQYKLEVEQTTQINRSIRFIDIVFSNKDARAVRDPNGTPFFYYAFIDKTKILFAQDPKLLNEISRKIKEKNLVR